jgi:hypothetical protein
MDSDTALAVLRDRLNRSRDADQLAIRDWVDHDGRVRIVASTHSRQGQTWLTFDDGGAWFGPSSASFCIAS